MGDRRKKQLDLTDERLSPTRIILQLTWPLLIEQILATLVSYADTAMVGALGVNATTSVSICNSFVFLINGAVMALGVGITTYVARSVGAKDYEGAKAYIRHALLLLLYVGGPLSLISLCMYRLIPMWMGAAPEILDTASEYLLITSAFRIFSMATMMLGGVYRGRGDMKTTLRVNILVNIVNIIGNYFLIHPAHEVRLGNWSIWMPGAGMEVAGAALSTGFSWMLGGLVMIVLLYTKRDSTRISIHDSMRLDVPLVRRVIQISIPAMLERVCMSAASVVVSRAVASLGTVVYAANSIYVTAESISFMPGFAFATSATTLVGQSLGANKPELAKKYAYRTCAVGAVALTFSGIMIYVFAQELVSLFTPDARAIELAMRCLRQVAYIQPIQVIAWILAGALRGAGDTKWPFYITALGNWLIRTLGGYLCICVFHLGLPEAVLCACADSVARTIFTWLRFRLGRWQYTLSQDEARATAVET